ncbi:MAG: winged helix-turn-helix domain-containing protein [Acidimicrobiia bacterium]
MFVAVHPPSPSQSLISALLAAGLQPVPIGSPAEVTDRAPHQGFALAVVQVTDDLGLAIGTAGKLRSDHGLPVLLVTDRTNTADLDDLDGFDDFLLSPIDVAELRVRAARLSLVGVEPEPEVLRHRELELNTATYQATLAGEPRDLTYMEYELLRFFVENPGRVWSRQQLLLAVWGYDYFGGARTVDVHVRRLRAKLGEERSSWITTVRSVGYRFG